MAARLAQQNAAVKCVIRLSVLLVLCGCAVRRDTTRPWVGTWRLIAVESLDSASGVWRRPFGDQPSGYVVYGADGMHTMNFTRMPAPPVFVSGTDRGATESELRQAFEGYFSWFGRYAVNREGGTITHNIEGSLWPTWRNTMQVRPFVIRGDTLLLGDPVKSRRVLVRVR